MNQLNTINFEAYSEYLQNWHWQWFTTLTFDSCLDSKSINKLRLNWTRSLCTSENIQVAYFYVEAYNAGHPHLHLLMLGTNKQNKTLLDLDPLRWQSAWPYRASIAIPESNSAVSSYIAGHLSRQNSEYDIYNKKLLYLKKLNYL
jgi:hypothetical protein